MHYSDFRLQILPTWGEGFKGGAAEGFKSEVATKRAVIHRMRFRWCGVVWYGTVWYGMAWYGEVYVVVIRISRE